MDDLDAGLARLTASGFPHEPMQAFPRDGARKARFFHLSDPDGCRIGCRSVATGFGGLGRRAIPAAARRDPRGVSSAVNGRRGGSDVIAIGHGHRLPSD
jgi:hypothetical protein